ncbi:MAG TPA: SHOCT domain-containing protein [Rubrobacter sp.]|nr:SHOCT domain-containing protein [Rubrobacter sp.]
MGLMAERGANRMQARQTYRTASRMQRRRSYVQSKTGMREDFSSREEPAEAAAPSPAPATAPEPEYVRELERLSQLRDQGILSDEEFEAKKEADPRDLKTWWARSSGVDEGQPPRSGVSPGRGATIGETTTESLVRTPRVLQNPADDSYRGST